MNTYAKIGAVLLAVLGCVGTLQQATAQGFTKTSDIAYRSEPIESDYAREQCKLDVYQPDGVEGYPTIVFFHGGGLRAGTRQSGELFARRFTAEGIGVVLVSYRLSPKATYPAYVEDAAASVAWTFEHIAGYGGDSDQIYLSGHSAGGYLTLMLGMDKRYLAEHGIEASQLAGLMPISGQTITHSTVRRERETPEGIITVDEAAPVYYAAEAGPPCLLICGGDDLPLRADENRFFFATQQNAGNKRVSYLEVEKRDHDTIYTQIENPDDEVALAMLAFMRGPSIESTKVGETRNVTVLGDRIYFAGQPSADDLAEFSRLGVETVVNLKQPPEMARVNFDERATVEASGMKYLNVPIGGDPPSDETLGTLFDLLSNSDENKVLLHCGSSNRVGYIWAVYRGVHDGLELEKAIDEGKRAGMRSEALEKWARDYIAAQSK